MPRLVNVCKLSLLQVNVAHTEIIFSNGTLSCTRANCYLPGPKHGIAHVCLYEPCVLMFANGVQTTIPVQSCMWTYISFIRANPYCFHFALVVWLRVTEIYIYLYIFVYHLKCTVCQSTLGQHCPMQHYDQVAS